MPEKKIIVEPIKKLEQQDKKEKSTIKEPKKRNRWSNYFITVNTNKSFTDPESPETKAFEEVLTNIYNNLIKDLEKYVILKIPDSTWKDNILKIQTKAAIEIGNEQHRLHFHALIRIFHNSLIKLNLEKIREDFKNTLGYSAYLNVKSYGKSDYNIENYINKYYQEVEDRKNIIEKKLIV